MAELSREDWQKLAEGWQRIAERAMRQTSEMHESNSEYVSKYIDAQMELMKLRRELWKYQYGRATEQTEATIEDDTTPEEAVAREAMEAKPEELPESLFEGLENEITDMLLSVGMFPGECSPKKRKRGRPRKGGRK